MMYSPCCVRSRPTFFISAPVRIVSYMTEPPDGGGEGVGVGCGDGVKVGVGEGRAGVAVGCGGEVRVGVGEGGREVGVGCGDGVKVRVSEGDVAVCVDRDRLAEQPVTSTTKVRHIVNPIQNNCLPLVIVRFAPRSQWPHDLLRITERERSLHPFCSGRSVPSSHPSSPWLSLILSGKGSAS